MPRSCSIFHFSGSLDRISIRVQLFQKGIQSLDFDRFNLETSSDEQPTNSRLDDVTFGWKQKVGRVENSTRRIFTLVDDDEFPEFLKVFQPEKEKEIERKEEDDVEYPLNDQVVYRKSRAAGRTVKKSHLFIFARLGPTDMDDPTAIELIARITSTDSNRLVVEPDFTGENGILMETKFGDFSAKIKIEDKEKGTEDQMIEERMKGRQRKSRGSVTSIPEADHFSAARDGLVESVVNVSLVKALDLLFEDGLTVEYQLRIPAGVSLKSENSSGRSQRYSCDEEGIIHLDLTLEFVFESPRTEVFPLLMLRLMAVDYWGRQYIAGYGSTHISLDPGRNRSKVCLWRPISHNSLYEMFVGQAIDVDYFAMMQKDSNNIIRLGVDNQPSGVIFVDSSCISQSRQFMASDILYQMKYGSKMADVGLRPDFYQRIMKVLMEFEEARSKLILARTINKQKIKE